VRPSSGGPFASDHSAVTAENLEWSSEASARFEVEAVYRGTEFTIKECSLHPHANVLYEPRKKLSGEDWQSFLAWSRRFLNAHWRDCGVLIEADEAIKYSFKPTELSILAPPDLAWLHSQLHRI
jgi:hypothetical protein